MSLIVTYFVNKRIALPYIFAKYCLPKIKLNVTPYLIHHNIHTSDERLESNRIGPEGLERVRSHIDKLSEFKVISHQELFPDLYLLPSCKIGLNLGTMSPYHLWLEDDAIVCDSCETWADLMERHEVGIFRQTNHIQMFNSAFMVSTKQYDARLLENLKHYTDDNKIYELSSQFEHILWKTAKSHCLLDKSSAMRHHPRGPYKTTAQQVIDWLKFKIPNIKQEHLELVKSDYADSENN